MIEKMHTRTNGPVFKVIFALVSLSFVLTGVGTGLMSQDTSAAKVNGSTIEQQNFNAARGRQQNLLNQQMGQRFWELLDSPEYVAQFNQSVLNDLIDEELLRQYAKTLNLNVSADQIKSEIVNNPAFQQDGKFSNAFYQQTLRNNGISADQYAAIINEGMLFSQLQEGIVGSHFSVPAEQERLAKLLLQERKIRLATYSVKASAEQQHVNADELQAYYDAHKATLLEPEKLNVEYVMLTPEDVAKRVQITDEQIQTYYDTNKADYTTKGEMRVAHIQVADEATAQSLAQAVKNGEDFATLAKTQSTDKLSANQGGDLGWAKAGTFPPAFETAANALNVGEVSNPIKVDGAYHIIKVLDKKPQQVIPLPQVKDQIAKTIRDELVLTEYSNLAREMANQAAENSGSLDIVAQTGGVQIHKTATFTQQTIPAELNNEKVIYALFNSELRQSGQNSEALDVGTDTSPKTLFVRVSNYQAERAKTLDEAKTEVETAVKAQKAEKALLTLAEENVKSLEQGNHADVAFGDEQSLVYLQSEVQQPVLSKAVFAMPNLGDKPSYRVAHNDQGDVVIIALDKVIDGNVEAFKPIAQQFNQAEQLSTRNNLIRSLRDHASIDINQEFMDQNSASH